VTVLHLFQTRRGGGAPPENPKPSDTQILADPISRAAVHAQVYAGIDKRCAFGLSQPASIVNPQEYQGIITPSHHSDRTYIFLILRIFTILPVSSGRA